MLNETKRVIYIAIAMLSLATSFCSLSRSPLIGRWVVDGTSSCLYPSFEFVDESTVIVEASLFGVKATHPTKYRIIDDSRFEWTTQEGTFLVTYEVSGDKLKLVYVCGSLPLVSDNIPTCFRHQKPDAYFRHDVLGVSIGFGVVSCKYVREK
jgi:hypothetical protein